MTQHVDEIARAINDESFLNWDEQFGRPMARSLARAAMRAVVKQMRAVANFDVEMLAEFLDAYMKEAGVDE